MARNGKTTEGKTVVVPKAGKPGRYGHPEFAKLLDALKELHEQKNHAYAFGGPPLGNFKRVGSIMKLYPKMDWSSEWGVALMYELKQLDSLLWLLSNAHQDQFEGLAGRISDRIVYNGIAYCALKDAGLV